jgi:hypothetical protein
MRRIAERALWIGLALLGAAHVVLFLYVIGRRFTYPFDLEWMEGGMLLHAKRIADGQPIYGPPSIDFVPYLYTPLYPVIVAILGKLFGISYALGRFVSLASLAAAIALGYRAARRAGAPVAVAAGGMVAVLAAFPFVGQWYDIVRNDELFLALGMGGLYVLVAKPTLRGAALGAALLVASYFAKQTGEALLITGLVVILVMNWRIAWVYAVTAGALWAGLVLVLNATSHGWFWNWCFRAHAHHDFNLKRVFYFAPKALLEHAPVIWLAGFAAIAIALIRRAVDRQKLAWILIGAAGVGLACLGFGTQWAWTNAYIPGVFFPLVTLAVLADTTPINRFLIPSALVLHLAMHFYNPKPFVPTANDRTAGQALLARIAASPGDVFVPFHPWYPVMVGKPATVHRMGIMDAPSSGFGRPLGLDSAISEGRFTLVIVDNKFRWEEELPTLRSHYQLVATLEPGRDAPHVFAGADTIPRFVLAPATSLHR